MSKYILVHIAHIGACTLGAHFSASGFVFCDYRTQLDRSVSLTRAHASIRVKARIGRMGAVCTNAWASMYFGESCSFRSHTEPKNRSRFLIGLLIFPGPHVQCTRENNVRNSTPIELRINYWFTSFSVGIIKQYQRNNGRNLLFHFLGQRNGTLISYRDIN